jgi:hypothetical protein
MAKLAGRSKGELRVVDEGSAYLRLPPGMPEQGSLYSRLRVLLAPDSEIG